MLDWQTLTMEAASSFTTFIIIGKHGITTPTTLQEDINPHTLQTSEAF
jgi:hypothetical protein